MFDLFYGELGTAPMVAACPLCMECRLDRVLDFPSYDVFVGEIHATYADQAVLTGGRIDYAKVRPLLFDFMAVKYWGLGRPAGDAYSIGKKLKTSGCSVAAGEGSAASPRPEGLPPKEDA